jgi:hypothetical protein
LNRRDLLKITPALAATLPAQQAPHAGHAQTVDSIAPAWKPLLFDPHQNRTVQALAELIIPATDTPGAREARVHEYIDLILHDGPADRRNLFLQGLGWLDGYALRLHAQPFADCTPARQTAILQTLDTAADPKLQPGTDFFRAIKRLTAEGYYTTEIGVRELNKGGRVPASFACQPGDH